MSAETDVPAGLMFVEAPPAPETANFLLYGPPKSGKSTAAATAPGPIVWVSAEGPGALAYARKVANTRGTEIREARISRGDDARQTLRDTIVYVKANPDVQTVVVDTLAKVREALIRQIVVVGAKNSIQQFGEVARILREFVQTMRDLPVNFVLIAHQDIADSDGERIVRPLIGGALTEEIPGEVDVIAYTHSFKDEESGERRYVGQLVEAKGRIAGDRSGGLGQVRDLDLTDWLAAYRAALTPDDSDVPFGEGFIPDDEPPVPLAPETIDAEFAADLVGAGMTVAAYKAALVKAGFEPPAALGSKDRRLAFLLGLTVEEAKALAMVLGGAQDAPEGAQEAAA